MTIKSSPLLLACWYSVPLCLQRPGHRPYVLVPLLLGTCVCGISGREFIELIEVLCFVNINTPQLCLKQLQKQPMSNEMLILFVCFL